MLDLQVMYLFFNTLYIQYWLRMIIVILSYPFQGYVMINCTPGYENIYKTVPE